MNDSSFSPPNSLKVVETPHLTSFSKQRCFWGLFLPLGVHAALVMSTWGKTYWDFGDGNYLYIARRLTQGVTLYRDILAPQPPLHLLVGAGLAKIGEALFGPDRWFLAFRAFSLLLRSATALVLFGITRQIFASPGKGLVAAGIWLFLPIGFWWQLGYQSEPLEIFFLLLAVWGVWRMERRSLILAGFASALAAHCNMTAAPYFLCNAIFLLFRRPKVLLFYLLPFTALYGAGAIVTDRITGGAFLENVILNQTGTFPRENLASYITGKILKNGRKILELEGVLMAFSGIGIAHWTRKRRAEKGGNVASCVLENPLQEIPAENLLERLRIEYIAWTAIGHFLSLGFVAKGGTVDYIFTIGEPFVAVFAAYALLELWQWLRPTEGALQTRWSDTIPFLRIGAVAFVGLVMFSAPLQYLSLCVRKLACELPEKGVEEIAYLIDHYTQPGDPLLTPPFYAMITNRLVAGEYSENYIWTIKYKNETEDGGDPGLGILKVRELAQALKKQVIPLVILDMGQTGRIPEIIHALQRYYHPVEPEPYRTYNTSLTFWVPRTREINHLPLSRSKTSPF